MDEFMTGAPQFDARLVTVLDFLEDEQVVDLALAGCERSYERDLSLKEIQYVQAIKAELFCRVQSSRRVCITMRD